MVFLQVIMCFGFFRLFESGKNLPFKNNNKYNIHFRTSGLFCAMSFPRVQYMQPIRSEYVIPPNCGAFFYTRHTAASLAANQILSLVCNSQWNSFIAWVCASSAASYQFQNCCCEVKNFCWFLLNIRIHLFKIVNYKYESILKIREDQERFVFCAITALKELKVQFQLMDFKSKMASLKEWF